MTMIADPPKLLDEQDLGRLLDRQDLERILGMSRSTIERRIEEEPDFPRGVKFGRARRWHPAEVNTYIDRRFSDAGTA